jgi:hypothetical protein
MHRPSLSPTAHRLRFLLAGFVLSFFLGGCAVFSYQRGQVYQKGVEKLPVTIQSFRIEGSGYSPVFDESARIFFQQALKFEGFDLRLAPPSSTLPASNSALPLSGLAPESQTNAPAASALPNPGGLALYMTLLVTRPELLSSAPASFTLVVDGRRDEAAAFSHTFIFRHPWGVWNGAFMSYFSSAARTLRLRLASPARPAAPSVRKK